MRVGFLGLGTMGAAMAGNVLAAGHEVTVWNRSPGAMAPLVAKGAMGAGSAVEAAATAEVLVAMLADDAATRAAVIEAGALAALPAGAVFVNMATVSVAFARELAAAAQARGVGFVAAPVLGRPDVAAAGKLNILAGGPAEWVERVRPVLAAMGAKIWPMGEAPEQANAAKLAVNFMIGSAIEAMGEAAALAEGFAVPRADFLELVTTTLFASPVYAGYGRSIMHRVYEPAGFKLALGLKDVRLALEAADGANVPMPFASVLKDNLLDALAHGDGAKDFSALAEVAVRRAGKG